MTGEKHNFPDDYNALYDPATRSALGIIMAAPGAESQRAARPADTVPDVMIDYDEATQNPVRISPRQSAGRLVPRWWIHRRQQPVSSSGIRGTFGSSMKTMSKA